MRRDVLAGHLPRQRPAIAAASKAPANHARSAGWLLASALVSELKALDGGH